MWNSSEDSTSKKIERIKFWENSTMNKYLIIRLIILQIIISITIVSAQSTTVKVGHIFPGELDMGGFRLTENSEITLSGVAASFDEWDQFLDYYAWILNSDTREVVWRLVDCDCFEEEEGTFEFKEEVFLYKGNYEIYFSSAMDYMKFSEITSGEFIGKLFNKRNNSYDEYSDELFVEVTGPSNIFYSTDPRDLVNDRNENAAVSLIRVGDSEKFEERFSLKGDTNFKIYGIGEGIKKQVYDYGYIYDVHKNKRVWIFNKQDVTYAGGGSKNILVKKTINLPKGSYTVTYITDDSHSFDGWNVKPPDDPQYWGITIFPVKEKDRTNVVAFREVDIIHPVVGITKVGDDKYLSQGFSLKKSMNVRILALGEGLHSMVDYGWIINADTRETIWKMKRRYTEHAGGAEKNRMIDEIINLKSGNYILYYVSDDSHSYKEWNSTPPFEEDKWGITIWPVEEKDLNYVSLFDEEGYKRAGIISEIIKVGDDEYRSESFQISRETKIRIISIGEGSGDEMNDYGWIENEKGVPVWEMTYRKTSHAGGAKKNRLFNDTIILPAGNYKLYYRTDDSHSFQDWNSTPPDNKELYGISLLIEN